MSKITPFFLASVALTCVLNGQHRSFPRKKTDPSSELRTFLAPRGDLRVQAIIASCLLLRQLRQKILKSAVGDELDGKAPLRVAPRRTELLKALTNFRFRWS